MDMLLDLSQIRGGSLHVERTDPPSAVHADDGDFRLVSPVKLVVDVHKDAEKVRLTGRVSATMEVGCSRCLEPFTIPVDAPFELLFLSEGADTTTGEHRLEEADAGVSFYRDNVIDLAEAVREQFLLALPMKPLCREDCQGLCPICGINRNTGTCTCESGWVDPRLAPLSQFKRQSES